MYKYQLIKYFGSVRRYGTGTGRRSVGRLVVWTGSLFYDFLENVGNLGFPLFAIFRPPDHDFSHKLEHSVVWAQSFIQIGAIFNFWFQPFFLIISSPSYPDGRLHVFFLDKRTNGQAPYIFFFMNFTIYRVWDAERIWSTLDKRKGWATYESMYFYKIVSYNCQFEKLTVE